MKTNTELHLLAAKAAGYEIRQVEPQTMCSYSGFKRKTGRDVFEGIPEEVRWTPLVNDGDEARLEAALCLNVLWSVAGVFVGVNIHGPAATASWEYYRDHGGDRQAARRRAGVRAAAAIGEAME